MKQCWVKLKSKFWLGSIAAPDSDGPQESPYIPKGQQAEILSVMGPEKNISLPGSGEEALKRLLSVKGQDPYSILGIRSDSSDDTVKRYYKKQAVLVHPDKNVVPGAEEGFKILQRAFELVGDPVNRLEYHRQILEANEKKRVTRELEALLEQLRKKMESVSNSIRCTKCNSRHKKNRTDRPLFAARYCAQCRIHHAAREGDLWAEKRGFFGLSRQFFACMEGCVWEINEWASCQKKNLKHLLPDSHNIMYRLVAGGKGCNGSGTPGGNQNCGNSRYGKSSKWENSASSHFHPYGEPMSDTGLGSGTTIDDWHTIVNNLCRSPHGPGSCPPSQNSSHSQSSSYSSKPHSQNGSSATPNAHGSGNRMFDGSVFNMMNGMMGTSNSSANSHCGKTCMDSTGSSRKRSKVKRK